MSTVKDHVVLDQLQASGYLSAFTSIHVPDAYSIRGVMPLDVIEQLRHDERFYEDMWNFLHTDIPEPRTGFRSYSGTLGKGSTQIVVCTATGEYYADVDAHNTQDVANIFGHLFVGKGVVPNWLRRIFGRTA